MELRIYSQEANQPRPRHRLTRWLEEFERWAAPEVEPERAPGIEQEQERSFLPVAVLLGVALLHRPSYSLAEAGLYWMVPLWTGERVLSVALALTAAVVEETFFRGFAIVWTYRWSGSLPFAVLFPALVFSAGHAYLGWLNILFAFAVTLGFSAIFLWRRDLYWLMVVHFVIDVLDLLA